MELNLGWSGMMISYLQEDEYDGYAFVLTKYFRFNQKKVVGWAHIHIDIWHYVHSGWGQGLTDVNLHMPDDEVGLIGVFIAPSERHKGYAKELLLSVRNYAKKELYDLPLYASPHDKESGIAKTFKQVAGAEILGI